MYKACIFDLDGTLTDTLDSLVFSVNETLKEMGLKEISRDKCRQFVGNGARRLIELALLENGEENLRKLDTAMEIYGRVFDKNCTYRVVPYDGICELLEAMHGAGMKLAVLSNKPDKQAVHVAEEILGKGTFQWIQGQKEGVPRKPDPTAALQIAEKLGAEPSETIYIGDSEVDVATGKNAAMLTIGVAWGFRGREELAKAGAEHIVDSPAEIIDLIAVEVV